MAETHVTKEEFKKSECDEDCIKEETKIRMEIGAISAEYSSQGETWLLVSTWKVNR